MRQRVFDNFRPNRISTLFQLHDGNGLHSWSALGDCSPLVYRFSGLPANDRTSRDIPFSFVATQDSLVILHPEIHVFQLHDGISLRSFYAFPGHLPLAYLVR